MPVLGGGDLDWICRPIASIRTLPDELATQRQSKSFSTRSWRLRRSRSLARRRASANSARSWQKTLASSTHFRLFQAQPLGRPTSREVLDRLSAIDRRSIPDDEQLAADLAQQHAQEAHDIERAIGVVLRLHKESPIGRETTHDGQMATGQRHAQERRLAVQRPRPHGHGKQVEAGLIYPDDGAPFSDRFFLRRASAPATMRQSPPHGGCVAHVAGRWTL
jgi:hypothetical protein